MSIPVQCPLPWVGDGDPVVPGQPAAQFVRNTNPSKLDEHGYCFFDQSIPLDILEKVEAEVDKVPIGDWDAIFQQYPGVHREDDTGDRILNALLARKDHIPQYSDVTHHELLATLALAQFILSVINKSLDDTRELYNAAHVAVTGRERQSLHRNMHMIRPGRRALTVFYAKNYNLNANDGTNTIMLPASRGGLPQAWEPVPVELIRGSFFVMYSDLIHPGGAVPRTRPLDSWRKLGFLGVANFLVTYKFTVGLHLPFWAQPDQQGKTLNTKPRCSMERGRKQPTTTYFACNLGPLCKDHFALLCPWCDQLQPRQQDEQQATDTSSADKLMSLDCGITCYMAVDVTTLYLLLQALPAPPPMPFRVDISLATVKPNDCPVRERAHEAEGPATPQQQGLDVVSVLAGHHRRCPSQISWDCCSTRWRGASRAMALGHAPREHTTFGPKHHYASRLVEGVAEGWPIPPAMWSSVNCTMLGACVWCACVLCDKLAILDSTAAHVQPWLMCPPPPPAASVH